MSVFRNRYKELADKLSSNSKKLSMREKILVSTVLSGGVLWFSYVAYDWTTDLFDKQQQRLSEVTQNSKFLPERIDRYSVLRKRREEIEERFKSVEVKETVSTYIEALFGSKIGNNGAGLSIAGQQASSLGEDYQLEPYTIRFTVSNVPALVGFLKEVAQGKQPLLLKELDLGKTPQGDKLDVNLKVATIRKKGAQPSNS